LNFWHNEILENKYWKEEDDEIRCDVDASIGEVQSPFVNTMAAWNSYIPEIGHWCASKGAGEECFDTISYDNYHSYIYSSPYVAFHADTEVLKEDGHFCEKEAEVVDYDTGKE
jgi:hypothetical protein